MTAEIKEKRSVIDESLKASLRISAAENGRSMEEEARRNTASHAAQPAGKKPG